MVFWEILNTTVSECDSLALGIEFLSTPPVPCSLYIIVIILPPTEESENSLQQTELPENLI